MCETEATKSSAHHKPQEKENNHVYSCIYLTLLTLTRSLNRPFKNFKTPAGKKAVLHIGINFKISAVHSYLKAPNPFLAIEGMSDSR